MATSSFAANILPSEKGTIRLVWRFRILAAGETPHRCDPPCKIDGDLPIVVKHALKVARR